MSHQHHLDNQGFCHTCGKPLPEGMENWVAYNGDFTPAGVEKAILEWEAKLIEVGWEPKDGKV